MREAYNNQAKALSLFQGLRILDFEWTRSLLVIGDSSIIIRLMCHSSPPMDCNIARLIFRIQQEEKLFDMVEYFHVIREHNK